MQGVNTSNAKMATRIEDFLCEDDFDTFLAIFRSYGSGANGSQTVEKIAADEKDYH